MGEEETNAQVYESCKVTPDECCPACKLKGQTRTLQTYRISFKESIVLCQNPQCIYPLGHKPLQTITASAIDLGDHRVKYSPRKRKTVGSAPPVSLIASPVHSIGPCAKQPKITVCPESCSATDFEVGQDGNLSDRKFVATNDLSNDLPFHCSTAGSLEHNLAAENITISDIASKSPVQNFSSGIPQSPIKNPGSVKQPLPEKLGFFNTQPVIAPEFTVPKFQGKSLHLQWRNKDALCWLDCILSSFVHLKTLKVAVEEIGTEEDSIFKQLLAKYNQANALQTYRSREDGHFADFSSEVLVQAEKHLNEIRSTVFDLLQPQLKCQLGKNDMPVFALPLFIEKDPSFQNIFKQSFVWEFECLLCGHKSKDRCSKTLTTFTKVIPEWHPLHAVHVAPCNNCLDQFQRRKMILEKVPAVFILHFSEGLPHSDLKAYSFQFGGGSYEITTVIQYQNSHFATWALTPEGYWLECDDLKGPYCWCHGKCEVPPSEIHIVYWEKKNIKATSELNSEFQHESAENLELLYAQSRSPNQCDGVEPRSVPGALPIVVIPDALSTDLPDVTRDEGGNLFGFKDLGEEDVITLTLEEIQVDSVERPQENVHVIGLNGTIENYTLQPQARTSVSQHGETSPNIVLDDCPESQSSSMYVSFAQSNPKTTATTLGNHSTCLSTIVQIPELSEVENDTLSDNHILAHVDPQFRPAYEGKKTVKPTGWQKDFDLKLPSMNVIENGTANNPPEMSNENPKKGFASNWVKSLIGRHPIIIPSSLSVSNPRPRTSHSKYKEPHKISGVHRRHSKRTPTLNDDQLPVKRASSFGGFVAKGTNKTIEDEVTLNPSGCRRMSLPLNSLNITSLPAEHVTCTENNLASVASPSACKFGGFPSSPDKGMSPLFNGLGKPVCILNGHQKFASSNGDSVREHKIHKLRLKLLRKLKAKKTELASLDMLANAQSNGNSLSKTLRNPPHLEYHSKHESLQDLLKALQEHIDNVDNESVHTMSSNNSLCSSPGDAEFLAELFSPTNTQSLEMRTFGENGSRLLEMLVDQDNRASLPTHLTNGIPCTTNPSNGHHDYSLKEIQSVGFRNSLVNGSSFNCSNLQNCVKEDVFEDLLSSAFSSVGGDTDLCHFDENFFESC